MGGSLSGGAGSRRPAVNRKYAEKENAILYTIAVLLIVLWVLGQLTSYTMGGTLHLLPLIAIVVNVFGGRRRLW